MSTNFTRNNTLARIGPGALIAALILFLVRAEPVYAALNDMDMDGVLDALDNCSEVANPDQLNTNNDRYGNACDPDINNDEIVNYMDLVLWQSSFNSTGVGDTDFNGDGVTNFIDFAVFPAYFLNSPGPSGITDQSIELQLTPVGSVFQPNPAQYRLHVLVEARDVYGRPVPNLDIVLSVVSTQFKKGYWCVYEGDSVWTQIVADSCPSEDTNENGLLDPGEDTNNNGALEPGNILSIAPASISLNSNGLGVSDAYYPQVFGEWIEARIDLLTLFQGTVISGSSNLLAPVAEIDISDPLTAPPGYLILNDGDFVAQPNSCLASDTTTYFFSSPFSYNSDCSINEFNFHQK